MFPQVYPHIYIGLPELHGDFSSSLVFAYELPRLLFWPLLPMELLQFVPVDPSSTSFPQGLVPPSSQRKRRPPLVPVTDSPGTTSHDEMPENRRKTPKISRACDACKSKKARCSGTKPCDSCVKRRLQCVYNAKYSRGRPPTPLPRQPSAPPRGPEQEQEDEINVAHR